MDAPKAPTAYQFVMDGWTPETIPMKRLAQYIDKLSALLGSSERVHFDKITKGSVKQLINVEEVAAFEVNQRVKAANDDDASDGAKVRKDINRMLQIDECIGYLRVYRGPTVIEFPGRKTPISEEVTVHETGDLEGMVIRAGGKDTTVTVTLEGSDGYYICKTSRTIAKQFAQRLFDGQVSVSGKGKWLRNSEGVWSLEDFHIASFEVLESTSLTQFVKDMRAVPGSTWNEMEDPHAELKRIRGD